MDRKEVYEIIDSEREYQRLSWGDVQPDGTIVERKKDVESFLLYMEDYLHNCRVYVSHEPNNKLALEHLRKVIALGVHCLEQHETVKRDISNVKNKR